ncbi:DUF6503 family protein [Tenacibaculum sp. 190524A02b]|uniref:DUF6503 family protein n=1 Tax=Tenacibaculum vairaonense TaxID=3137860 RepID=UPI0031FA4947
MKSKEVLMIVITFLLLGCKQEKQLNGSTILKEAILVHDANNNWNTTQLNLHIQEPRKGNPHRYSILNLDNNTNVFRLKRNRDQYISEHVVESDGNSFVLLDGSKNIDSLLIEKYRLNPSRNIGYKKFYHLLYGLPMTLNSWVEKINNTSETIFNGEACYKIELVLKEAMFSKHWNVFISKEEKEIKGIEMIVPEKPDGGERIYFEGNILVNGINIPRVRHWHEFNSDAYSGSDIIVKEILIN